MARTIAAGIGIMEYPFDTASGFWKWVDLCEAGGIDSIWQTDRLVSKQPILECMTALAAIAGGTETTAVRNSAPRTAVKRMKYSATGMRETRRLQVTRYMRRRT